MLSRGSTRLCFDPQGVSGCTDASLAADLEGDAVIIGIGTTRTNTRNDFNERAHTAINETSELEAFDFFDPLDMAESQKKLELKKTIAHIQLQPNDATNCFATNGVAGCGVSGTSVGEEKK